MIFPEQKKIRYKVQLYKLISLSWRSYGVGGSR